MYAQVEKSKENKSRAVANSVTQKKDGGKQGFGLVDNRPGKLLTNQIQFIKNATKERSKYFNDSDRLIQRAVIESGTFSRTAAHLNGGVSQNIMGAWNILDGLIPQARINAQNGIQGPLNAMTNTQRAYALNVTAAGWGSCVEEQLNALDTNWTHQYILNGARPDYQKDINGVRVYADLTTITQAGMAGDHITQKLNTANIQAGRAVAADVTHPGRGVGQIPPQIRGIWLSAFGARQRHKNSRKHPDAEYNQWAEDNMYPTTAQ